MIATARLTLRQLWRDRRLPLALGLLLALAGAAIALDRVRAAAAERERAAAEALDAQTFAAQGARNPHAVAHFSRFAFRPRLATAALDPGASDYAGTAVWMEAHRQNPPNARAAEDQLDLGRASDLGLGWIWQVVAPLLVIALAFDAIARERERRTLAIALAGGASLPALVAGKGLALYGALALALLASAVAAALAAGGHAVPDGAARTALWVGGHLAYLAVWVAIALAVSVRARTSRAALVALLGLWAAAVLVAPRIVATVADEQVPIPSGAALREAMDRDLRDGFDGHAPADERSRQFEARVLAQYGVGSVGELPVSFAGLRLEEGERVGNLVYDRHYARLAARYAAQRAWRRASAVAGPLAALQHVSTAAAGTDVEHQLDLARQAEQQRRAIVGMLNADLIAHGAGKDMDYVAGPALWAKIPAFRYAAPALDVGALAADLAILGAWLAAAAAALAWAVRGAAREVVP